MRAYTLSHLTDRELIDGLHGLVAKERENTAAILAHLGEVEERGLFAPAGYSSMTEYCVRELRFSEDAAGKRIHAARAARRFPAVLAAVADGRLHLSAVVLLAPRLTPDTANDLLEAAAFKTKSEIELLLAERFPRSDVPTRVQPLAAADGHAPGRVEAPSPAPGCVESSGRHSSVSPLAPQRYALQVTIDQSTHDKLRHAQALLSHCVPGRDVAQVLDRALDALIAQLEKRKYAATDRPRPGRVSANPRHIPASVKRAVRRRDGNQCTFVSDSGRQCTERRLLEYDHVEPVARGGQATVDGIRLRCRVHNQHAADRVFGAEFMKSKRRARRATAERADETDHVIACLRKLGYRSEESLRAAEFSARPGASLEDRVRLALSYFTPRVHSHTPAPASAGS